MDFSPSGLLKSFLYERNITRELYGLYAFSNLALTTRYPAGENIYQSDWDALIILDALRVDALHEVADEYSFIEDISERTSVGSTSKEWLLKTFTESHSEEIAKTTYVTGNGFVHWLRDDPPKYMDFSSTGGTAVEHVELLERALNRTTVHASTFEHIEELWSLAEVNPVAPVPDAESITEHAIAQSRNRSPDRLLVHYMQPHAPYVAETKERGQVTDTELSPFAALIDGTATREEIWNLYIENTRYVLDSVADLLENIDAEKAVITADHGELFGEWYMYGHTVGFPQPKLKRVPWVETSAEDQQTIDPDPQQPSEVEESVEDHLEDLGYKEPA